jgi:hypothetical protein
MTQLLDAERLRRIDVNPFADEPQRSVPLLHWIIDPETDRPVARWRQGIKPAAVEDPA